MKAFAYFWHIVGAHFLSTDAIKSYDNSTISIIFVISKMKSFRELK